MSAPSLHIEPLALDATALLALAARAPQRYPVLLEEFAIRANSGGAGKHHGGNGVVRRIRFREAMSAAILSTRRETSPFGLEGGEDAARGTTTVIRTDGTRETLRGQDETKVAPGDCIEIATPGGGGFGYSS